MTNESAKNLSLKAGDEVTAIIKASHIIIGA
ncbi:MAG: TOBE domain-containing protein [Campylobacter sp.]